MHAIFTRITNLLISLSFLIDLLNYGDTLSAVVVVVLFCCLVLFQIFAPQLSLCHSCHDLHQPCCAPKRNIIRSIDSDLHALDIDRYSVCVRCPLSSCTWVNGTHTPKLANWDTPRVAVSFDLIQSEASAVSFDSYLILRSMAVHIHGVIAT